MNTLFLISTIVLWLVVGLLAFLLLGTLRSQGLLSWRLAQLEATTPSRIGRSGLKPGRKAPDFTLASTSGGERSLHEFAGRRVLLVFVQAGCAPCEAIVPELNRLAEGSRDLRVVAVNQAEPNDARQWAREVNAAFPVLIQEQWSVSKRYEVFATPFAFLIDEQGVIASKGIVSIKEHVGYVLSGAGAAAHGSKLAAAAAAAQDVQTTSSPLSQAEVQHV